MPITPALSEDLTGRVALVTGGSRGIGRAACLALAARGAAVLVHYHASQAAADEVVAAIQAQGRRAAAVGADLLAPDAGARLVAAASDRLGPVDILVNNAGEFSRAAADGMPDALWERALALNLTAPFRCARACIPSMRERGWGRIVNVSSQAAYAGSANHAHYAAAKAGLLGFSFSLAKELGPSGITVNVVMPGRIATDMLAGDLPARREEWLRQTPLGRLGTPDEVAAAIAFLASGDAGYITGAVLQVGGGLVMG